MIPTYSVALCDATENKFLHSANTTHAVIHTYNSIRKIWSYHVSDADATAVALWYTERDAAVRQAYRLTVR